MKTFGLSPLEKELPCTVLSGMLFSISGYPADEHFILPRRGTPA